jgi:hypothetical protein
MSIPIDLTPYKEIRTQNLVTVIIKDYRVENTDLPIQKTLRFTDGNVAQVYLDEDYLPVGRLMTSEYGTSNIRTTDDRIQVTLSGVPISSAREIINSSIKGSFIQLDRAFFNTVGEPLPVRTDTGGNVVTRFIGYVDTYNVSEVFDSLNLEGTVLVTLECLNAVTAFKSYVRNLKTNPAELRAITSPVDVSFDRVPNLVGANFNFGAQG